MAIDHRLHGAALLLGGAQPAQSLVGLLPGVHPMDGPAHALGEELHHVVGLPAAQQSGVHQQAAGPLAQGFDGQTGGHGGIHAAGEHAQGLSLSHLPPQEVQAPPPVALQAVAGLQA